MWENHLAREFIHGTANSNTTSAKRSAETSAGFSFAEVDEKRSYDMNSSDLLKSESMERVAVNYRREMASYLKKIIALTGKKLISPEEISNQFVRGVDRSPYRFILFQSALLLTKTHIHMIAALRANERNNIHSLAVHMRVILECAGQVVECVMNALNKDVDKLGSSMLADFRSVMFRMIGGSRNPDGELYAVSIENTTREYREDFQSKYNKKLKTHKKEFSKTVKDLEFGENWYRHISERFVHSDIEDLRSISYAGGVTSCDQPLDIHTFAFLLDYLVHQSLVMLIAPGLLLKEVDDTHDIAIKLIKNKKRASAYYGKIWNKSEVQRNER